MSVFFFRVVLECSLMVTSTGANQISYGTMHHNFGSRSIRPRLKTIHMVGAVRRTQKMSYRKSVRAKYL
ncbi:hypothetical protein RHGRI_009920 [Rhododendron griersonianum]|uniref:Secreted protein n=1 Tax=Rhododendron griersonianum TaxID=479676 RepID=A0AAV6KH81_9ERIC|nr:hypothetical protein RHGRI_009920 [Rhododendron griersonianum]